MLIEYRGEVLPGYAPGLPICPVRRRGMRRLLVYKNFIFYIFSRLNNDLVDLVNHHLESLFIVLSHLWSFCEIMVNPLNTHLAE